VNREWWIVNRACLCLFPYRIAELAIDLTNHEPRLTDFVGVNRRLHFSFVRRFNQSVKGKWHRLTAAFLAAVALLALGVALAAPQVQDTASDGLREIAVAQLPSEARATIRLIKQGGPFPYERDGIVFRNFEKQLPSRDRGYYREYTVRTPGVKSRGARRIVAGRGGELYYTDDHYRSFRRVRGIPANSER
jgi:ribonuclease T1